MKTSFLLLCLAAPALAQFYNISTVAGIGRLQFSGGGGAAINARLIQPVGVAADSAGNVYVSDAYCQQVFQISAAGVISVYAGNGLPGFSGDGGPATQAQLYNPQDMVVDAAGNLYICDYSNGRVRKVTPGGTISTAVALTAPFGIDIDATGNLYVSQSALNVISKVTPAGEITTIAGNGKPGFSGDGGPALSAMIYGPEGLRLDAQGNVYSPNAKPKTNWSRSW